MVAWHHRINGHVFEQTLGDGRERQWHPTPVLLPGKSHGLRDLVGYSPCGDKELDTTELLNDFSNWIILEIQT